MEKATLEMQSENYYHSKEFVSQACSEIFENILRKTYDEENPFRGEDCDSFLMDKPSCNGGASNSSTASDFSIIPRQWVRLKQSEARTILDSDSCRSRNANRLTQKITHPFKNLHNASDRFTYRKPDYGQVFQDAILEEDEDTDCEDFDRLISFSREKLRESRGVQTDGNVSVKTEAVGNCEREITITNDSLIRHQIDKPTKTVKDFERPLLNDAGGSISIRYFYTLHFALLLTINTLTFFSNLFVWFFKQQ